MRPHGVYPAEGQDEWVAIAVRDERDWRALCDVTGRPISPHRRRRDDIDDVLAAWTAQRPAEESERLLQRAGVPAHHVLNATTARVDPHVAERGMFVQTTYAGHEALITSSGYHFSSVRARAGRVPRIGEDSVGVLSAYLGYAGPQIDALLASGAISTTADVATGA